MMLVTPWHSWQTDSSPPPFSFRIPLIEFYPFLKYFFPPPFRDVFKALFLLQFLLSQLELGTVLDTLLSFPRYFSVYAMTVNLTLSMFASTCSRLFKLLFSLEKISLLQYFFCIPPLSKSLNPTLKFTPFKLKILFPPLSGQFQIFFPPPFVKGRLPTMTYLLRV